MEFSEVLRRRRTVRHDTDQPLAPEVVERVLDAALRAPSAGSSQGWAFLVLTEPADRARFWPYVPTQTQTPTMTDAPLVVGPLAHEAAYRDRCARPDKAAAGVQEWPVPFRYVDSGMAALCMLLTAGGRGARRLPVRHPGRAAGGVRAGVRRAGRVRAGRRHPVGYRHPDLAPQDSTSIEERRRRKEDVVHRGQW